MTPTPTGGGPPTLARGPSDMADLPTVAVPVGGAFRSNGWANPIRSKDRVGKVGNRALLENGE